MAGLSYALSTFVCLLPTQKFVKLACPLITKGRLDITQIDEGVSPTAYEHMHFSCALQ